MSLISETKGQTFFLSFMIGITVLVLALSFAPGLNDEVTVARNASNMDCGNSSISTFDSAACIVADVNQFYFIGGLIFIAMTVITARIIRK